MPTWSGEVPAEADGHRLDHFLVITLALPRNQIQRLIKDRFVTVNDKAPSVHQWLHVGDAVAVMERPTIAAPIPEIKVVKETADYIVVHKPVGVLTHPAPGSPFPVLTAALVERYPELSQVGDEADRPGIVHRLDRDVSGLLVVARTPEMFTVLKEQFRARQVDKRYTGLVEGVMPEQVGTIAFPISRSKTFRGRMAAHPAGDEGRAAETRYSVITNYTHNTLLSLELITGRMHQIRVHLKALGHPLVGDTLYGPRTHGKPDQSALPRIFLQSTRLEFNDLQGERQTFEEPLDSELQDFLKTLS